MIGRPHGSYGGCISWIMNPSATYRSKLYCIVNINVEVCTPHRTHNIRVMQSAKIENNKNKKKDHTHLWQGKEHISHNMKSTHIPKIIIFFYFIATTMVDFFLSSNWRANKSEANLNDINVVTQNTSKYGMALQLDIWIFFMDGNLL